MEQIKQMNNYDFCIVWNWEYDKTFVMLLNDLCISKNLSVLQITPENLHEKLEALDNCTLAYRVFFDRASEDDDRFMPFVRWANEQSIYCINRHDRAFRSWNKTIMHYELIHAGIYTPHTVMVPSYEEQPVIQEIDLQQFGGRFIIKPVHGSGGEGVYKDVSTMKDVLMVREKHPHYRYMLQSFIVPQKFNDRPAWFRVLYCSGQVYACWWNPDSHFYQPITEWEEIQFGLEPLASTTKVIANIIGLDFFSTEIALATNGLFVVVDYVNDQPDLRLQSTAADGVPNAIVHDISNRLCSLIAEIISTSVQNTEIQHRPTL
jgi:hypothetical protein